ncbi:baseplate J/gp47 family protein [Labrenzia sp. OB1]|uniref:baseplate J/gp47 family protein n=1 Tax=Labrenzia sp. OB1 TaxID=1561204 RepID=UPI0007B26FB5|nr:baseplate J/gp47 family protein [Labrenzia sp. OB1]KZM49450.1 hypothetical protein OA90_15355 [Labrenzia sp. OB1]
MIDLDALPDPEVLKPIDFDEWLARLTARFSEEAAEAGILWDADLASDPVVIQIQLTAFYAMLFVSYVNEAARNQILKFSTGADLNHLASFYGLTRLAGETDARLRQRIQLATIGGSVGGTAERFKSIAMGADLRVRDLGVWTEGRDPTVRIAVLSTDIGGDADATLLAAVKTALEAPDVRLVSDRFEVTSAVRQIVDLSLTVTLAPDAPASLSQTLKDLIVAARDGEDGLLGLDLTKAWITKSAMIAGITNVRVEEPLADVPAGPNEAIAIGAVTILDGGRDR